MSLQYYWARNLRCYFGDEIGSLGLASSLCLVRVLARALLQMSFGFYFFVRYCQALDCSPRRISENSKVWAKGLETNAGSQALESNTLLHQRQGFLQRCFTNWALPCGCLQHLIKPLNKSFHQLLQVVMSPTLRLQRLASPTSGACTA